MDAHLDFVLDDLIASIVPVTGAVLCRVWLAGPGDLCSQCSMAPECPDRTSCLHLARSAGLSRRLDGPFRRFPLGAREVGRVATSLEPQVMNGGLATSGLADPAWLSLHGIASFGAWPLPFQGRCLGVLALFSPRALTEAEARSVAATARLAASALGGVGLQRSPRLAPVLDALDMRDPRDDARPGPHSMADVQRAAILAALARTRGKVSGPGGAAEVLGMKSTTLESRMRKLGLRKPPGLSLRRG